MIYPGLKKKKTNNSKYSIRDPVNTDPEGNRTEPVVRHGSIQISFQMYTHEQIE